MPQGNYTGLNYTFSDRLRNLYRSALAHKPPMSDISLGDIAPVSGERLSLEDAERAFGEGNYGTAIMAGLGAFPVVPAMTRITRVGKLPRDIRFDPRVKEQEKLGQFEIKHDVEDVDIPTVSLADFEGQPFVTSMSDRTAAGDVLLGARGRDWENPVVRYGGQDYMFHNPGQVWASGAVPASAIYREAQDLKRITGESPIYLPWRMSPSGGDFAHMTGEVMIEHGKTLSKKNKAKINTRMKKIIPDWKGIDSPEAIAQYREAPTTARRAVLQMLDRDFRDVGGLSIGEARLAVTDPRQLQGEVTGLQNVGRIDTNRPMIAQSGHPSYPYGVPGEGLGLLAEDITVADLLPHLATGRPFNDFRRALEMKPYGGIITEDMLRSIYARQ